MEEEAEEDQQLSELVEGGEPEVQVSGEDQEVLDKICNDLVQRPHLSLPLLEWMIPEMSFAPSKVLTGPGSKRFTGKIGYTHREKGFSFVLSPEAKELFGVDVWLHPAQRGNFQNEDEVNFAVLLNKQGKPQAFDLVPAGTLNDQSLSLVSVGGKGKSASSQTHAASWNQKGGKTQGTITGPPVASSGWKGGSGKGTAPASQKGSSGASQEGTALDQHIGVISSFKPDKNYGFIQCAEIHALYGKDVWLHGEQLAGFNVGDTVSFTVIENKGSPQARDLQAPSSYSHSYSGAGQKGAAPMAGSDSDQYVGEVTAFYPSKGFGFVHCPDVHNMYGKDVWVHHAQIGDFKVGDTVSFTLIENKGNPQGIDLQAPSSYSESYGGAGQKGAAPVAGSDSDQYVGEVKAFYPSKGFGFLHCPEVYNMYGKDIWVHSAQIGNFKDGNFTAGDPVSFTLILNKDGNPQAIDLQEPSSYSHSYSGAGQKRAAPMAGNDSDQHVGEVKAFYPSKGFGFIHCPEVYDMYGKDIWVHSAQIGNFTVGETVSFTLILNKDRNPQAIDLQAADGEPQKRSRID